ncbi:sulfotransferase family 2 domain-containing protein [Porifericola rhodea]|uniref:sulfotransferase family 2 domain-containing protein n=1 Tax=Porifericola rhodea TaxID=930972 RepID=UPI002666648C|nr:sulfotransferase family 2 domain-containing protein [Porifericola rhodea]WKN33491.1 sulfotransferase family 2 domain-containing protein [Porifericola rhodea]
MKHNIIFMHIPKNGGSSFRPILLRHFRPESTFTVQLIGNDKLNIDKFVNMPQHERDQIHCLLGHTNYGLHEYMNGKTDYIAFLRKPVDRIISFYYYVLSLPEHRLYDTITKNNMSLYDFVLNINQGDVNNGQIRYISGIRDKPELMLERALENIEKHFPVVGFLEQYDKSLVLLKHHYQFHLPYYRVRNKTKKRKTSEEISKETIELIQEMNKEETLLYHEMEKRFNAQLKQMGENKVNLELNKLRLANQVYNSPLFDKSMGALKRIKRLLKT